MPPWPTPGGPDVPVPSWFIPLFVLSVLVFFGIIGLQHYLAGKPMREFWLFVALFITACAIFFVALNPETLRYVAKRAGAHFTQMFVAGIVIGAGWSAAIFKRRNQLWYGYVEVFFGVMSAIAIVSRTNFAAVEFATLSLAQFGGLVGCIYVVARGLTNIREAKSHLNTPSKHINPTIPSAERV